MRSHLIVKPFEFTFTLAWAMAAVPRVCAAANWLRHRHGNVVAMSMNYPVAEASSSTPRNISTTSGLQESRPSRVNVLVASVVSASVCVSLGFQAGCALAASDNTPFHGRSWFPWEQMTPEQDEPKQGTCSTCIGVVDDTLGACSATTNCVSSFDDRFCNLGTSCDIIGTVPYIPVAICVRLGFQEIRSSVQCLMSVFSFSV